MEYLNMFVELGSSENSSCFESWDIEIERWSKTLSENFIIKDLSNFILEEIHSTSISDEEREGLYVKYLELRIGILDKAIELAKLFARPNYPTELHRN